MPSMTSINNITPPPPPPASASWCPILIILLTLRRQPFAVASSFFYGLYGYMYLGSVFTAKEHLCRERQKNVFYSVWVRGLCGGGGGGASHCIRFGRKGRLENVYWLNILMGHVPRYCQLCVIYTYCIRLFSLPLLRPFQCPITSSVSS
jgi:hypothetical protein